MENQFLRAVAKVYVGDVAEKQDEFAFVFPNRRSMKFFRKYLGEEYGKVYGKPLLSPKLITINELFTGLSGLNQADSIEALYVLYTNYLKLKPLCGETFDEFIHWGDLILRDFDDIDKYLVDAAQLFTNIKDLKELESDFSFLTPNQRAAVESFWRNFLRGEFTDKKEFFSTTWGIMYELYCNFRASLKEKKIAYEGQVYREVADNCESYSYEHKYVFIGLNAPNSCERTLMKRLRDTGRGDFYWDFYGSFVTDKENSAYDIISGCVEQFPSKYALEGLDYPIEQKIKVIGVPSGVGQAFAVANILKEIAPGVEVPRDFAFRTAVVLPDEKLLMPVLSSVPKGYTSINVTMGYPISGTGLISFMNLLRVMQGDVKERGGKRCFYHRSLIGVLSHEYIKRILPVEGERIREWILKGNRIFIEEGEVMLQGGDFLKIVFNVVDSQQQIIDYQISVLKELEQYSDSLEREFIYQYYLRVNRIKELEIPMEGATYFRLISQLTNGITIPFRGEPLSGLQVMGSLEVRALDFDNIIITSVNEGVFPSSNTAQSLIPYNLRFGFGLPTYELQDGIAAYHFYRSISRAKNVFLIYDTRSEGLCTGEVSRYVKQLKYHFNIPLKESVAAAMPITTDKKVIEVAKTPQVMELLEERFVRSDRSALSASALNNYIACPLKFYFENVEGIREDDQVEESVESNTFGTLFHDSMQCIYDKYKYELISNEILAKESKDTANLESIIKAEFNKLLSIREVSGQNIIIMELLKKYIRLTLKEDENYTPFTYISSEERYRYGLSVFCGAKTVNFKAFVDRIDELEDGTLRIIDYKTGAVDKPNKSLELATLFDSSAPVKYKALLQLYLYALIVVETQQRFGQLRFKSGIPLNIKVEDDSSKLELVIYPLKKIKRDSIFRLVIYKKDIGEFKELLTRCVEDIFNPDIPFAPNPAGGMCKYCKLNTVCGEK